MTPHTVRWGILATGGIAKTFTKDLLTNPAIREVSDVKHELVAAASSSSASRAEEFLKEVKAPSGVKAYGSYHELVKDPNVDIIYVATPHSHHFQNTMLCLEAGKNVLCEKAFTVNAEQAKKLVETAKAKNLFLMEAVWTRYFPLSIKVRELVKDKTIGDVKRVIADLSITDTNEDGSLAWDDSHRMVNKDLAGGALLDLGIYALTWNFQILYHCQEKPREAPKVVAAINPYKKTGADENTAIILQFPKHEMMGVATTSLIVRSHPTEASESIPAIRIYGTKGEIQIFGPAYRPIAYKVLLAGAKESETIKCHIPTDSGRDGWGHGMYWEADEAARCLRDGKKESETLSWEESIVIMETMDEVRRQGGLTYPELIETSKFDAQSPLNGKA